MVRTTRFGLCNVSNGRNSSLESALRGISKSNVDLGVFQKTKFTKGINTRESAGYHVVVSKEPIKHNATSPCSNARRFTSL